MAMILINICRRTIEWTTGNSEKITWSMEESPAMDKIFPVV